MKVKDVLVTNYVLTKVEEENEDIIQKDMNQDKNMVNKELLVSQDIPSIWTTNAGEGLLIRTKLFNELPGLKATKVAVEEYWNHHECNDHDSWLDVDIQSILSVF